MVLRSRNLPVLGAMLVGGMLVAGRGALAPAGASAALASGTAPIMRTDASDFTFASFDAVYELSADDEGHSVLRTTETLVAEFPETDQNRGIQRAIPLDYDGHPVEPELIEVTDESGAPRAYETDEDDGFLVVTIAADEYVHGAQTYVITYDQRNVTHRPDDADIDEFAWDVNGTGWEQPFDRVTAELHVDEDVASRYAGEAACYQGAEGATTGCDAIDSSASPLVITAEAGDLGPHETLTIAAAFEPGTFTPRDDRFFSSPAAVLGGVAAVLAIATAVVGVTLRRTRWRDHPGRGIIVAEYEPPEDTTVMEAAELVGHPERGVAATLLALAVGGELRVIETAPKKFAIERVRAHDDGAVDDGAVAHGAVARGDGDARQLLRALFPKGAAASGGTERRDLAAHDAKLGKRLYAFRTRVAKRVVENGWRRTPDGRLRAMIAIVSIVAAVTSVVFGAVALDAAMGGPWPLILFIAGLIGAAVTLIAVASVRPLTEEGRARRDRLEGLREYIRLAEADRLAMLQSPSGALRAASGPARTDQVLRITERLLPYAVLFGLDREWSRELAALYDERQAAPGWYDGRDGFNPVLFAAGVHGFTAASTTSWSGSSSSSSSSASSGGGAAGGGGGGGGGGGV